MKANEFLTEEIKQRLDDKCWKGYKKQGTKIKGGVRVNNCVPNESVAEGLNEFARSGGGDDDDDYTNLNNLPIYVKVAKTVNMKRFQSSKRPGARAAEVVAKMMEKHVKEVDWELVDLSVQIARKLQGLPSSVDNIDTSYWDKLSEQGLTEMDNRSQSGDRREQRANSPEAIAQRKKELQANLKKVSPELRKKLGLPEPKKGVAEGDSFGMKDGRPYSDPLRRHPGNDSYMTPEYLIQKYQDELKKIAAGPYKRPKDVAMYQARIAKLQRQQGVAEGSEDFKARLEKRKATLTPAQKAASEKIMKKTANGRGISNKELDDFRATQNKQGVAEGIVDTIRAMNYDRLARRSLDKADDEFDKMSDFAFSNVDDREPYEKEFSRHVEKMQNRRNKAAALRGEPQDVAEETHLEETYHGDEFYEAYGDLWFDEEQLNEAEYQGRKVSLGKPMQGDVKKFKVYVKDPSTGNIKKVNFGDPNMRIKKSNPERRKSFRARHNCENPGPKTKARYWSCRKW